MNVRLGKDLLDLVSGAMYIEPLTIYRELIQNSIDAIDTRFGSSAQNQGVTSIAINQVDRTVVVEDNGCGLRQRAAPRILLSIGESDKRGSESRGFRGVGRLAGLGYCKKLRFETKFSGEVKETIVEWDGIKFRKAIKDPQYRGTIIDLIEDIATVEKIPSKAGKHEGFFRAYLCGVIRLPHDRLLNEEIVTDYIAEHCPVPFSSEFSQGKEVELFLRKHMQYKTYDISIGQDSPMFGDTDGLRKIYKPFGKYIGETEISEEKIGTRIIETSGGLNAIWYLDREYSGAIVKSVGMRGLRARLKNIQIGEENIFSQLFKEARFNSWVSGEIHIGDPTIVPNGRRDNFEPGPSFTQLETSLLELTHSLSAKCRQDSSVRNRHKAIDSRIARLDEMLQNLKNVGITNEISRSLRSGMLGELDKLEELTSSANNGEINNRTKRIQSLRRRIKRWTSSDSTAISKQGRKAANVASVIFEEIIQKSTDKKLAADIITSATKRISKLK